MYKIFLVAIVVAAVNAQYGQHEETKHVDYYAEPHYYFAYDVKDLHTKDIKSHKEERKGDHTRGVYSLVEPDGSKRVVEYEVKGKKGGWEPKVHREPLRLKDKHGHEGVVHANQNLYQGKVQEVIIETKGGYEGGSSGGYGGSSGGSSGGYGGSSGGSSGGYGGYHH